MIGDLGERQTRQKHAKRDSQVLTHSSQPLAKKQRSDGAGGIGGRRLAPSILGDNRIKKLDKHALLQRNVMYKYKFGQVREAFENNGLCQLLVRFEHDSSLLCFDKKLFVEDVEDPAKFQNSDKVLLLPRHLHSRGSVPRPLSIGESNVFYYEENVVCEVPENSFGPDYEYIRFQIFDPSHTDIGQRMDVEQSMQEARLSAETDFAASHDNQRFSFKLKGGTPCKLKIFDTNKCRCGEIAANCRCKRGRGFGVMAEQDIRQGEVVMEYVGVVKLKPGKTLPLKDRGGKGTNASDGVRKQGHNSTKERERGMPPKIKLDGTKLCPQDSGDAEHGKSQKEKGKQCEEVNAEGEGVSGSKNEVEDGEGRGVPMTQQAVVEGLISCKFTRFFPRYGWFEGKIISFNEVDTMFLVRYTRLETPNDPTRTPDDDKEELNFRSLNKYLKGEDRKMVTNFLKSQEEKKIGQEGNGGRTGSVDISLQNIPQMDGGIHGDESGQECHDTNPTRGGHVVVTRDEDSRGGKLARAADTEGKIKDSDGSEVGGEGSSSTGNGDRGDLVDEEQIGFEEEQIGFEEEEVSKECGMQNYISDPDSWGRWQIDASEKGNVRYFSARTHADVYVIVPTQHANRNQVVKLC